MKGCGPCHKLPNWITPCPESYAKLYGLTEGEPRYILDPKDVHGEDFPSETFRVLKEKELRLYGEYRTKRLVLEAWEELHDVIVEKYPTMATVPRRMVDAITHRCDRNATRLRSLVAQVVRSRRGAADAKGAER